MLTRKTLLASACLLVALFSVYPIVFAVPERSASYWCLTATLKGYEIVDSKHVVVSGLLRQDCALDVWLLDLLGWVSDQDGTVLGHGSLIQKPVLLKNHANAPLQILVESYYALNELGTMNIQSVHFKGQAAYCVPYSFSFWSGCWSGTYIYEHTWTRAEVSGFFF